jgi:hypothetical protein
MVKHMKSLNVPAKPSTVSKYGLLLLVAIVSLSLIGCAKYTESDPPRVGTFYPNGTVSVQGTTSPTSLRLHEWTIRGPVTIREIGMKTYEGDVVTANGNVGTHEVACLDLDGGLWVWTSTLNQLGRVEYRVVSEGSLGTAWRNIIGTARAASGGLVNSCATLFFVCFIIVCCVAFVLKR